MGELRDSGLVARSIDAQSLVLVGSPGYLQAHGTPTRMEQLTGHRAIAFRMPTSGRNRAWHLRQGRRVVEIHPQVAIQLDDTEALRSAARLGLGLTQLPDYIVEDDLAGGNLIEVMREHRPPDMPISAVVPSGRLIPLRVKVVVSALETLRTRKPARK